MFEMGHIEEGIVKQSLQMGVAIPERIENAPQLRKGLELYLNAFLELDSDRQIGFSGPLRISWSSIASYANFYSFDSDQAEALFVLIRKMDNEHLKRLEKKYPQTPGK